MCICTYVYVHLFGVKFLENALNEGLLLNASVCCVENRGCHCIGGLDHRKWMRSVQKSECAGTVVADTAL